MKWIIIFFLGSIWGSFFFTLALRYIIGSFQRNAIIALISSSRCPKCQSKISIPYLIPIIGYLLLNGRCQNCKKRVSPLYPIFEVIYGILLILIIRGYGINAYSATIFLIAGVIITISIIDVKILTIPNSLILVFIILSIYPIILNNTLWDTLYGLLLMSLFFIIILFLFPGSFGGGDLKFASSIGLLFGIEQSIVVLEAALCLGAIMGIIYALKTGKGLKTKIPFAPFLSMGVIISFLYGRDIVLIYYRMIY